MKKLMVMLLFSVVSLASFATIRTVSNFDSAAQYKTIQAAIDSSNTGDSIYVGASATTYDGFTINNKKLAVFGPGWSPDKSSSSAAMVNGCNLTGPGASGSELHGIVFTYYVYSNQNNDGVNNILFIRNKFASSISLYYSVQNYVFEGNWFDNVYLYGASLTASNFTFTNNIFYHTYNYNVYNFNGNNIQFNHNLWYGPTTGNYADCFANCQNLTLINNIFIRRNAANGNTNSSFQNNITYLTGNDTAWSKTSQNRDDGGNIAGTSPQMVDEASVENGTDNPLLNFTLTSASAAHNKGNDGNDMGLLYGTGRTNWARSRGVDLPFISRMTLTSNLISAGSNLSVTVDAKSN